MAGATFVMAHRALVNVPAVLIALAAYCAAWKFRRVPEAGWILLAGAVGQFL